MTLWAELDVVWFNPSNLLSSFLLFGWIGVGLKHKRAITLIPLFISKFQYPLLPPILLGFMVVNKYLTPAIHEYCGLVSLHRVNYHQIPSVAHVLGDRRSTEVPPSIGNHRDKVSGWFSMCVSVKWKHQTGSIIRQQTTNCIEQQSKLNSIYNKKWELKARR